MGVIKIARLLALLGVYEAYPDPPLTGGDYYGRTSPPPALEDTTAAARAVDLAPLRRPPPLLPGSPSLAGADPLGPKRGLFVVV